MADLPKLAAPALRALGSINIRKLEDLANFTEQEISDLHGMGLNALQALRTTMSANKITFKALSSSEIKLIRIGNPATNALSAIGIMKLEQLTSMTEKELLNTHGVGPKAFAILKEALKQRGLTFAKQ